MKVLRSTLAALACSLTLASALGSALAAEPLLSRPERVILFATGDDDPDGDTFPLVVWHFDLIDSKLAPRGTLDVYGVATGPAPLDPTDPDPPGIITMVVRLSDGDVVAQGLFGFNDEAFEVAVVGGTGRYRKARGQVRVKPDPDDGARIVLRLLP